MATETLLSFFIASLLLALAPGPDNIFVLTHALLRGRKAGLAVVMGLCTGLLVHTSLVALGLAVILQSTGWALMALKLAGALYLLYLAWQALTTDPWSLTAADCHRPSFGRSYRRGVIMNITNPKVTLFFLAFLPQFIQPAGYNVTLQVMILGSLFIAATILVFGLIALLAAGIAAGFKRSPYWQKTLNRLAALVFIILAVHLILVS